MWCVAATMLIKVLKGDSKSREGIQWKTMSPLYSSSWKQWLCDAVFMDKDQFLAWGSCIHQPCSCPNVQNSTCQTQEQKKCLSTIMMFYQMFDGL